LDSTFFFDFSSLWKILRKKQRQKMPLMAVANIFSVVTDLFILFISVPLLTLLNTDADTNVNNVITSLASNFNIVTRNSQVVFAICLLTAVYVFKTALQVLIKHLIKKYRIDLSDFFTRELFSYYLSRDYEWHISVRGATLTRNVAEARLIVDQFLVPLLNILSETALITVGVMFLLFVQPLTTAIGIFCVAIIGIFINSGISPRIRKLGAERVEFDNLRNELITQSFNGIREIKIFQMDAEVISEMHKSNHSLSKAEQNYTFIADSLPLLLEMFAVMALSTLIAVFSLSSTPTSETLGVVVLFSLGVLRLLPSFAKILNSRQLIKFGHERVRTVLTDLNQAGLSEKTATDPNADVETSLSIELNHVSFKYRGSAADVLNGVSLKIPPRCLVGLSGPSGSGKTTFVDLLLGLLEPTSGSITFLDSKGNALQGNRFEYVGYVPQDLFLFNKSIRENVGLTTSFKEDELILECLQKSGLSEFVTSLPEGLDFCIGDNGARLSGGQRQRLGIARALFRNPSVLILDESTSGLDVATEQYVVETLKNLATERIVILISHRQSSIDNCDVTFVISNGLISVKD
jgi:ABC-type bacteriocin/lantibiotic exporter with double-glycine peptidase domain